MNDSRSSFQHRAAGILLLGLGPALACSPEVAPESSLSTYGSFGDDVGGETVDTDTGEDGDTGGSGLDEAPRLDLPQIGVVEEVSLTSVDPGPDSHTSVVIEEPNADFLKIHLSSFALAPGDRLIVQDHNAKVLEIFEAEDQPEWLGLALTSHVELLLLTGDAATRPGFAVDKVGVGDFALASIAQNGNPLADGWMPCGEDSRRPSACFEGDVAARARAVASLTFVDGGWMYVCTGWLASPANHFVSNEHCISDQATADTADALFGYSWANCAGNDPANYTAFDIDALLTDDPAYDVSLMTIHGNPGGLWGWLPIDGQGMGAGQQIYIPQHPGGRRTEIAYYEDTSPTGNCRVAETGIDMAYHAPGTTVRYQCESEGGASGSPVIDANSHRVVGLHNRGGCPDSGGNHGINMSGLWPTLAPYIEPTLMPVDPGGECPCLDDVDNYCLYGVAVPGCPMTWPGGYCDPNGDGSFADADWQQGYAQQQQSCGGGGGGVDACPCLPDTDNFCLYGLSVPGCPMTWPGGYCDPNGDQSFADANWQQGYDSYQLQCAGGGGTTDGGTTDGGTTTGGTTDGGGDPPCPCDPNTDNFCLYGVNNPECPPTQPGGYCDPNGDGSFDDADWDLGWYEYQAFCG